MSSLYIINEVFFALIEGIIYLLGFLALIDRREFIKNNKTKCIIFIFLFGALSYWFTNYLPAGINTVAHFIFVVLLLSSITYTNVYVTVITYIITGIFIFLSEIIFIMLLMVILNVDMQTIINSLGYKLIALILSRGSLLAGIIYVYINKRLNINIEMFKKRNPVSALPIFALFTIMVFFIAYSTLSNNKEDLAFFCIMFIATLMSLTFLYTLEFKERESMFQVKSKLESQQRYVENMESVIDIIRREKHDFANHLNTIAGMCKLGKDGALEKVDEYLENIIGSYQPTYAFYSSGSDFVNGLLAVKSNYAYQNDIYLDIDFDAPLSEADISDQDMVSIVSNIIDNAFEAMCSDTREYKKVLSILSYSENDNLFIAVSNNGPQISESSLSKIFNQKYTTKTTSVGRGYGLFIIKQITEKNGGEIMVTSTKESTEFLVKLKRKVKENVSDSDFF